MPAAEEAQLYRSHARSHYAEPGPPEDPWRPYIKEAAGRFDVPEPWVRAVIHQESGPFGQSALSNRGAMGLMQVMAPTYDEMRVKYGLGDDAYDPHDNIAAGTAYLRQMYDLYGTPGFLAAYDAGPGRLDAFLTRNKPLPAETRQYVAIIGRRIAGIYPNDRSQADLMATAAHSGGADYAAGTIQFKTNVAAQSVRLAWAQRIDRDSSKNQPAQVAAEPIAAEATPQYGRAWQRMQATKSTVSDAVSPRDAVAAAWSQRQLGVAAATAETPVHTNIQTPPVASNATNASGHDNVERAAYPARPQMRLASFETLRSAPLRDAAAAPANGGWAIQVGAFGSQRQASSAATAARSQTGLAAAHTEIDSANRGGTPLYRARIMGLSRATAARACARLGTAACIIVSPNAS